MAKFFCQMGIFFLTKMLIEKNCNFQKKKKNVLQGIFAVHLTYYAYASFKIETFMLQMTVLVINQSYLSKMKNQHGILSQPRF